MRLSVVRSKWLRRPAVAEGVTRARATSPSSVSRRNVSRYVSVMAACADHTWCQRRTVHASRWAGGRAGGRRWASVELWHSGRGRFPFIRRRYIKTTSNTAACSLPRTKMLIRLTVRRRPKSAAAADDARTIEGFERERRCVEERGWRGRWWAVPGAMVERWMILGVGKGGAA